LKNSYAVSTSGGMWHPFALINRDPCQKKTDFTDTLQYTRCLDQLAALWHFG
jgi:hypothetical protein